MNRVGDDCGRLGRRKYEKLGRPSSPLVFGCSMLVDPELWDMEEKSFLNILWRFVDEKVNTRGV